MLNGYYNNFTEELDKYNHVYEQFKDKEYAGCWRTYLWEPDVKNAVQGKENLVAFRVPGATRGHVKVDDNLIIQDIVFYEDTCFSHNIGCYKESIKEVIPKFLGTKLEIEAWQ